MYFPPTGNGPYLLSLQRLYFLIQGFFFSSEASVIYEIKPRQATLQLEPAHVYREAFPYIWALS